MTTSVKHNRSIHIKVENCYGTDADAEGFDWDIQYKMYDADVNANKSGWEIGATVTGSTAVDLIAALEDMVSELRFAISSESES